MKFWQFVKADDAKKAIENVISIYEPKMRALKLQADMNKRLYDNQDEFLTAIMNAYMNPDLTDSEIVSLIREAHFSHVAKIIQRSHESAFNSIDAARNLCKDIMKNITIDV